jgi:hypothetical protein
MPVSESLIMQAQAGKAEPSTIVQDISGLAQTPMADWRTREDKLRTLCSER